MKCVVTGGTGFLGTRLTHRLRQKGHDVEVVSRRTGCDITRPETLHQAFQGAKVVFHLAALVQSRPGPFEQTNLQGLENVCRICEQYSIGRLVNVSSFTVHGPSGESVHDESSIPERDHFYHGYDRTKFMGYLLARRWSSKIPMNIVFPTVIFGPGPLTEGNILIRLLRRWHKLRLAALPAGGRPVWNFVFVEDVVDGLLRCLRSRTGDDFILGGEDLSLRGLCELYRQVSGRRILALGLTSGLFKSGAYLEDVFSRIARFPPLVLPATADFFLQNWRFSSKKARSSLGYHPRPLPEAMESTFQWMKKEGMV